MSEPARLPRNATRILVADLDRPREGLLKVNQRAMIDLRNMMNDAR